MGSPGLSISMPTAALEAKTKAAQLALHNKSRDLLDVLGQMLLGQVQQAYVDKSRGGVGEDGVKWAPIQLGTLLARMRTAGHVRRVNEKEAAKIKPSKTHGMFHKVKSHGTKDAGYAENAKLFQQLEKSGAIAFQTTGTGKHAGKQYGVGSQFGVAKHVKTKTVSETLKQPVQPGGYQIGVDTGKQINTLQPGRSGDAGPSMVFEPSAVTVGAAMSYSPYFDKQRPIVPDHFPPKWLEELQEQATEYGAKVLEIELGKET